MFCKLVYSYLIFITRLNLFAKIKCVLVVDMDFVT